ncbi:porin [Paraburkholderia sp. Ac-20336]|uniref:porin n=1 Tax=Paraburkholderia sp. Ac-20336 TaxID=2703886 RepID=UPI00197D1CFB|nr:porin [Paraburkholderia sp. Ac-20336]MBN3804371.1 porin [Paraburkholderia sp. Ac-20336]
MNQNKNALGKPLYVLGAAAAIGLCGAPASANAESSVTLYGIVDVGIAYVNNTTTGGSQTALASGNFSGSRWGLKGVEDLGGGAKAIFDLEDGFNVNDGTTAQSTKGLGTNPTTTARLWGRQAWVGLAYKNHQLTFGRQNTLLFDQAISFDPFGAATRYSSLAVDSAFAGRADDSIKYVGKFGPITAAAMYSTRYDTGYGSEVPGAELTGRLFSGSLTYASGPLAASVLYEQRNSNTVATNTDTEKRASAAATYTFGPVKGFAGYRYLWTNNAFLPTNPIAVKNGSDVTTASVFWAGAQYFVTPAFALTGAAYYQDVHATNADPWMAVLSADYFLSKRTDLYANAAFARNKNGSNLGVTGYGTAAPGYDQTGFVVGIRHKF